MLVTLSSIKEYLSIASEDHDTFLNSQITIISKAVESYCNRKIASTQYEKTITKSDWVTRAREYIHLPEGPVISIDEILECESPLLDSEYELIDSKIYRKEGSYRRSWGSEVVVTYTAGYAVIPEDIQYIVKDLVAQSYDRKIDGGRGELVESDEHKKIVIPGVLTTEKAPRSSYAPVEKGGEALLLGSYVYLLDQYAIPVRTV